MARPPASAGRKRKRGIEMAPWRQFYRCRLARAGNRLQNSRLLDVADLPVREGDFQVLVNVDFLGPEVDDLVGFPIDRFHLGDGLSKGDCDRPRRNWGSIRCDSPRWTWGSIRCGRGRGRGRGQRQLAPRCSHSKSRTSNRGADGLHLPPRSQVGRQTTSHTRLNSPSSLRPVGLPAAGGARAARRASRYHRLRKQVN